MYFTVMRPLGSIIGLAGLAVSVGLVKAFNTRPLSAQDGGAAKKFRVAVIGSGIGGSSAAYFIREGLGPNVNIDVFEKAGKVGGRMSVVEIDGNFYEAGGSVIHDSNKYMQHFCNLSGLEKIKNDATSSMGIFDGNEFVYISTGYSILDKIKLFWRYGMGLIKMNRFTSDVIKKFVNVYELQKDEQCFETVVDFLKALGGDEFVELTRKTARKALEERGVSAKIIDELATAVTRCNYGQDMNVNAFTGVVSLAGAQSAKLWAVKGGNYQVCKAALQMSEANLNLNVNVKEIGKGKSDSQEMKYAVKANDYDSGYVYDAVVVAVPLEVRSTQIQCEACTEWPRREELGRYQKTVATFVKGKLNHTAFGFDKESDIPSNIFTTESPKLSFSSIGLQYSVEYKLVEADGNYIYKIFSREDLTEEQLKTFFTDRAEEKVIDWLAYPHYSPPEKFTSFKLDTGVFYVNAIERVASAMEMGAIGGKNAALLTMKYLKNQQGTTTQNKQQERMKGEL